MFSNIEKEYKIQHAASGQGVRGKKVVIIGDAAGTGRITAALLVERGAKVFVAVSSARELTAMFAAIAKTGGEWDGMVVDMNRPEEIKHFFDRAEKSLGRIDAVVNHLPASVTSELELSNTSSLCLQEAIQRLQASRLTPSYKGGHIINIGSAGSRGVSPALRRQASDLGIRMTLVTPGEVGAGEMDDRQNAVQAEDIARCVCDSLAQTFGIDVVFLQGQYQRELL
jgi:NAD(P)-dependent dehydrogenase (short-subunit alcohol dehydrogenase family)